MKQLTIINYALLWDKLSEYVKKAGRVTARPVLLLYYVMKSKDTPKSDKVMIFSTLAYLVFPIDLLDAKRLPIIGWVDEIASLSVAYQKMQQHITPKMEAEVDNLLDKWLPEFKTYVEV